MQKRVFRVYFHKLINMWLGCLLCVHGRAWYPILPFEFPPGLKTLLSRLPDPSLKPPFQNFLVPQFLHSPEITNFWKICISKAQNHWTNFYFSFTDCILPCWTLEPGGGYSAENGVQLCAALKTPLSRPPDPSLKPPFQNFLVPQDPTFAWNHKFLENLHFKGPKLKKSSVLMPNIRSSFSFKSLKLDKKSVKTPNLAEVFFFFFFYPLGHTHISKKES